MVWHVVLIWTALTQDALSHTQGKCKSVLITWVNQTERVRERERNVKLCQQTSTPSDLHYRPAAGFLPGQHCSTGLPSLCCCSNLTCLVAVQLWYDNTHFFHPCPLACVLHCVPSVFRPLAFIWIWARKEKKGSPTGDVSESSKLSEELLYMAGKLIGPLPNQSLHPQCVSDLRLTRYDSKAFKMSKQDTSTMLSPPSQKHSMWILKLSLINIMNRTPYFAELHLNLLTVSAGCEVHSSNCLSQGIYALCVQQ